jgi:hypothetical protein
MSNEAVMNVGAPVPAATGLSQVERVMNTFVAPSKTFGDILRSSSWWLPFLLLTVFGLATGYVEGKQVGFDRIYENRLAQSPKQQDALNQLPPDQKAARMAMSAKVTAGITYAFPVVLVIIFAIYALMLWGTFNFVLGANTTYSQCFAVAWYAALPFLVRSLLTIVFLYFGGNSESFLQDNPVGTNLGYYLTDAAPWLKALLSALDLVQLWSLALAILGMAIVAKKSIMQSALVVGGFWLLGVLLAVGGAAIAS